ncbi:MAG: ABC transporter ATP-binding protein [Promethearchaeota archaeon]
MSDSEFAIDVKALTFAYDVRNVVDNVSFSIKFGEVIGILGPNGAGKTTTIRLITGVLPLVKGKGSIRVQGKDISRNGRQYKSSFGIVPETSNAYLDFTVWENLTLSGEIYGLSKATIKQRGRELLEVFGLTEKKDAKTKSLSKGLKQRLNFCLALIHEPPILILDEPTSGLDPMSVGLVRQRISQFKKQGKTILLTTHDLAEAEKLCDKVLIINKGKIVAFKSPGELKREFKTPTRIVFKITGVLPDKMKAQLEGRPQIKVMGKDTFQLTTLDPFKDIAELYQSLTAEERRCDILKVTSTSLEEVFMKMIKNANKES